MKIEQGLGFFFVRPVLLGLRVNRTGASHVAPPSGSPAGEILELFVVAAYNDLTGRGVTSILGLL